MIGTLWPQPGVYIPEIIHKRLRVKSAETGRPMKELAAEASMSTSIGGASSPK